MGEPIDVPADVDEAGIESARVALETRLRELEARALKLLES
jgi:hypothetical protein